MDTNHKSVNRLLAILVFVLSLLLYLSTLAPTASFWDPGEFIAVSRWLEVTHPPGAPLFILLGHLFSMFMPAKEVAFSINCMSGLASALTIMFLYLIIVRLIIVFKGDPDKMSTMEKIGLYGGAIIGAFAFAVSDSFWFNAVEAEVYATSMFFTSLIVWLALLWAEKADNPRSDRWLILIAYMIGLAVGVHLLGLLTIFYVVLIVYFRKYEFTWKSFLTACGLSCVVFLAIYPFTLSTLPAIAGDIEESTAGLITPSIFFLIIIAIVAFAVYYTYKHKYRIANTVVLSYVMILIGFSSYAIVFIRASAHPAINEDNPETVQSFVSYINRNQYGSTPIFYGYDYNNDLGRIDRSHKVLFPRRWDNSETDHLQKYAQYSNDWDYFWDYQVGHMYLRYFFWQYIGRNSDIQDDGWTGGFTSSTRENNPAHNVYYYLPFFLGLIGMVFHFQKDSKRAFAVLALFIMTGFAIIVFLNQYPYQPRERDYSYVGSFFAYAIWIGIGATGLVEMVRESIKNSRWYAWGIVGISFLLVPMNMLRENYNDHDRHDRYVAPDYAYNLLESVAPYSILFTNGDNDTFPLWYLQEVEGVRTDVRVVCLSLLNTPWYIKQMKNQWSHQSPPLPISLTDNQIDHLEDKFNFDKPSDFYKPHTITIPVDKAKMKERFIDPEHTEAFAKEGHVGYVKDSTYVLRSPSMSYSIPIDSLDNKVSWYYPGRYLGTDQDGKKLYYTQIQDDIILNILKNNDWARPVYFAVTVSPQSQMNLQAYFRLEGQAYRLVPKRMDTTGNIYVNPIIHGEKLRKFRFRGLNNPHVYLDENIRNMMDNYRELIGDEAMAYKDRQKPDSAIKWLQWGEEKIPFSNIHGENGSMIRYAYKYSLVGDTTDAARLSQDALPKIKQDLQESMGRLNKLENTIYSLDNEAKEAHMNADLQRTKELQDQVQTLMDSRKGMMQDVYIAASRLVLVQHIDYTNGDTASANRIRELGDNLTDSRFPFPKSAADSKKMVDEFYGTR